MPRPTGNLASLAAFLACLALVPGTLSGCARGGEAQAPIVPNRVMDIVVRFAGPVRDAFYYYLVVDADDDVNDGPIPVASGPYWGNGWGTGSITHYVEYHQGLYQLFRAILAPQLRRAGAGIVEVAGTPQTTDAGSYTVTVTGLQLGAATLAGAGMATAATNASSQNAGVLSFQTDAAGNLVAGSVAFAPAADGGRLLTAAEQQQVDALNAGGQALAPNTFAFLGLTLQVGAPAAGRQTVTVAPALADVRVRFVSDSPPQQTRTMTGTLAANSATPTPDPPIPGLTIRAADLEAGASAELGLVPAETGVLLGQPYDFQLPAGGNSLRVTLDLAQIAPNVSFVSLNFISATELIFDPQATDRDHVYDANGSRGNDYISLRLSEYGTYRNGDRWVLEGADDATLIGPGSDADKASVDLVDWQVTVRRL